MDRMPRHGEAGTPHGPNGLADRPAPAPQADRRWSRIGRSGNRAAAAPHAQARRARAAVVADSTVPASPVLLRSGAGAALIATTVLASTVGFLNASAVNVAVPAIGRSLHASVANLQWVLTGYLVTVAALLLLCGALADHFGRRRMLVAGLVIMLASSLVCAITPTIAVLIVARLAQGAGAALVVPSSLALLSGTLRVADRARGIGVWAGLATFGATAGPYAGGWLVDHASWRAVFLLNVPLILSALWTLRRLPVVDTAKRELSVDLLGTALAVAGLGGVIYALTEGPASGWLSAPILTAAIAGGVCLIVLVPVEQRQPAPMLRLSLFRSRHFDAINVTTVLFYGALTAASYLLVLQCELRLGYSATAAGAVLIPESAVFLVLSPVVGGLVARFGPRWFMVAGILAVAAAFVWLSQAHRDGGYAAVILPATLLWGLGDALAATPLTAAVLAAVEDADLGEASAINNAASWVGGVVLIALVPVLLGVGGSHTFSHALAGGYQPAMIVMAALSVTAALISGLFVTNRGATALPMTPTSRLQSCVLPDPAPTSAP